METAEYALMFRIETTYWWFVGKRWLVNRFLARHLHGSGLAGMDVGCGTGGNMVAMSRFGTMSGCDIAPEAVEFCRSRGITGTVLQPEADRLPFPDHSFDFATSLDVLEHVENDAGMLGDIARVLKPGGIVLLTVPAHRLLWSVHDDSLHHKRRYSRKGLQTLVHAAGLEPVRFTYMNLLLLPLILPVRWLRDKLTRRSGITSDFNLDLPGWLNAVFTALFCAEWAILRFLPLPFGLSLLCVARKPK